jgi:hypothetical protein
MGEPLRTAAAYMPAAGWCRARSRQATKKARSLRPRFFFFEGARSQPAISSRPDGPRSPEQSPPPHNRCRSAPLTRTLIRRCAPCPGPKSRWRKPAGDIMCKKPAARDFVHRLQGEAIRMSILRPVPQVSPWPSSMDRRQTPSELGLDKGGVSNDRRMATFGRHGGTTGEPDGLWPVSPVHADTGSVDAISRPRPGAANPPAASAAHRCPTGRGARQTNPARAGTPSRAPLSPAHAHRRTAADRPWSSRAW